MLEPQTRAALTDQLKPPPGFELSHAVGTTFTLDLETALSIPLSFAAQRISAADGNLGVLDALRRAADNVDIFAQAGELSMGAPSDLVAFLEPMVHPVVHRRGLFHPKVWFLEYRSEDELRYRFICASRNLTGDRSWDVVVRLDGTLAKDGRSDGETDPRNAPLVELLRTLPGLAVQPLAAERKARIEALAERWRGIEWEAPSSMRDIQFHVFGVAGQQPLDVQGKRTLIISPFLSDDGVRLLRANTRTVTHLISRPESIDRLAPGSLDNKLTTYVLDDAASFTAADDATPQSDAPAADALMTRARDALVGLHAKAIVVDRWDGAHVFLGSANATGAAFGANIEVMVELVGPLKQFGVEATRAALEGLIEPYPSEGGKEDDADETALHSLESYLRGLAGVRLYARVVANGEGEHPYSLLVWAEQPIRTDDRYSLRWQLLTRQDAGASVIPESEVEAHRLDGLALTDITPFIVLTARDSEGRERRTIVLGKLLDDVDERRDAIIARQLTDTGAFIRLLTLILELVGLGGQAGAGGNGFFPTAGSAATASAGLFEPLVRAVGAGAAGLDDAKRIIDFLRKTPDGDDLLPEGFAELWESVWKAHEQLTKAKAAA